MKVTSFSRIFFPNFISFCFEVSWWWVYRLYENWNEMILFAMILEYLYYFYLIDANLLRKFQNSKKFRRYGEWLRNLRSLINFYHRVILIVHFLSTISFWKFHIFWELFVTFVQYARERFCVQHGLCNNSNIILETTCK